MDQEEKKLDVTSSKDFPKDVKVFGNPDAWRLYCKASNEVQGWMNTTTIMSVTSSTGSQFGCLVQTETQQRSLDMKSYALSQALVFVPNVGMQDFFGEEPTNLEEERVCMTCNMKLKAGQICPSCGPSPSKAKDD